MFPNIFGSLYGAINDPNVDLIPGVGGNEKGRSSAAAGGAGGIGIGNSLGSGGGAAGAIGNVLGASTGGSGAYAGGVSGGAVGDPTTASYYADQQNQLNNQLGQLDRQQGIGLGNIGNSYNTAANRLDQQNAIAQRNYDTGVQQNDRSYLNTRNSVLSQTRAQANALQRLLGMNGAGNSSAAYEQAPYAAALQGSQNLTQAQTTYGNNRSSLDTNWQDTQLSAKNAREDLDSQRYSQENSLRASIAQTRASLLDKIASAGQNAALARGASAGQAIAARTPFQQQINDLLGQITSYGNQYANPVLRTADVAFKAPDQADYSLNRLAAPTTQGGAQSDVSQNFLNLLTGRRDNQYGNLIN